MAQILKKIRNISDLLKKQTAEFELADLEKRSSEKKDKDLIIGDNDLLNKRSKRLCSQKY